MRHQTWSSHDALPVRDDQTLESMHTCPGNIKGSKRDGCKQHELKVGSAGKGGEGSQPVQLVRVMGKTQGAVPLKNLDTGDIRNVWMTWAPGTPSRLVIRSNHVVALGALYFPLSSWQYQWKIIYAGTLKPQWFIKNKRLRWAENFWGWSLVNLGLPNNTVSSRPYCNI